MSNNYKGEERREQRKESWHLSRSVPIVILLAFLGNTASIFWYGGGLEERVETLETKAEITVTQNDAEAQHEILQIQITNNDETDTEIKDTLESINNKLDRLIERRK